MHIQQGIEKIREIVGKMDGDERSVLDALVDEAENWKMRLSELEAEDEDE